MCVVDHREWNCCLHGDENETNGSEAASYTADPDFNLPPLPSIALCVCTLLPISLSVSLSLSLSLSSGYISRFFFSFSHTHKHILRSSIFLSFLFLCVPLI